MRTQVILAMLVVFLIGVAPVAAETNITNDVKIETRGGESNVEVKINNSTGNNNNREEITKQNRISIKTQGESSAQLTLDGETVRVEGNSEFEATTTGDELLTDVLAPTPEQQTLPTLSEEVTARLDADGITDLEVELMELDKRLVYQGTGQQKRKILGIIPVTIEQHVTIDAETLEITTSVSGIKNQLFSWLSS